MKTLYPLLLLCVLSVISCASEPAEPAAPAPATEAAPSTPAEPAVLPTGAPKVLFLGNSLSAGYGLDPDQAFPALVQQKITAEGWPFEVINGGLSGETTAGGLSRADWLLRQPIDVLVLELGGNDALRGIAPEVSKANLQGIIDKTRARYPDAAIVLAGMQAPPNLGLEYTTRFQALYEELAQANDAALIPFLLEGVGGIPALNLSDGIHPTAEGHEIVAENVWQTLRPVLASRLANA